MSKHLLIVFVKNVILGKVKTRLAKTIGDVGAFNIYYHLYSITEKESGKITSDRHIYFSDVIIPSGWDGAEKFVQDGEDLGERMKNAFQHGFDLGYDKVVLIGSDLPNITKDIINDGFNALNESSITFGPAHDGGYYLIGMSEMNAFVFENKPWSQPSLLENTLQELSEQKISASLLEPLNDIDTFDDLIQSDFYKKNKEIQDIVKHINSTTN